MPSALKEKYYNLSIIRQSNLLFHCFIFYMCTQQFGQAHTCQTKHAHLMANIIDKDKFAMGLYDNESIMHCVSWFFMKYAPEYLDFMATIYNLQKEDIFRHKKTMFMNFVDKDLSWIVSLATPALYQHARTLMHNLPEYEK